MTTSTRPASRAPALMAASRTARFSTSVTPDGMPITTRGRAAPIRLPCTLPMKWWIICSVTSKSEITPSCNGRMATICDGVRPTISFASLPIAFTLLRLRDEMSMATTDGSLITMPLFFTWTSVLAVPKSIPISSEKSPNSQSIGLFTRNLAPQSAARINAPARVYGSYQSGRHRFQKQFRRTGTHSTCGQIHRKITLEYTTGDDAPKKP